MSVRVVFLILLAFTNIFSATVNGRSQYRFVRPALSGNAYGQSETLYKKPTHFKPISNDKFEETASFYELGERGAGGGGKLVKRQSDAPTGPPAVVNQTPTEEPATVTLTGNAHADGGIKPVNGPYSKFSIIDGYQGPSEHDGAGSKRSFQSWSEYLDARRSALLGGLSHYVRIDHAIYFYYQFCVVL